VTPAPASSRAGPPVYHLVPVIHDPCRTYPMVTRRAAGITKPVDLLQLSAATSPMLSPVPTSVCRALANPHWRCAMEEEYEALLSNRTWDLVPRPPGANVVTDKWIFKHKLKADGSLDRYKARWVLWGFTQRPGVDFQSHGEARHRLHRAHSGALSVLAHAPARRQERFPSRHSL
jgi:hypothetical protein